MGGMGAERSVVQYISRMGDFLGRSLEVLAGLAVCDYGRGALWAWGCGGLSIVGK